MRSIPCPSRASVGLVAVSILLSLPFNAAGWSHTATSVSMIRVAAAPAPVASESPERSFQSGSVPGWSMFQPDTARRGMVPEDYFRVAQVGDPRISPDGSLVAFTLRRTSEDGRSRKGGIWIVPSDGSEEPQQFTMGDSDRTPRWSPAGDRLGFLRTQEEETQLHLIPMDGGEARAVTTIQQGTIADFQWFPDGRRILLSLNLDPVVQDPGEPAPADPDEPSPNVTRVRNAVYKAEGTGYLDERRLHLWELDPTADRIRPLTVGDSLWNDRNPSISPDGTRIAFHRDTSGEEYDGSFNRDILVLEAGNDGPDMPPQPEGRLEEPIWSPDGTRLAYRFAPDRYGRVHVHLTDLTDDEPRVLTTHVDLIPSHLAWHPDGTHLLFTADREGSRPLLRMEADGSGHGPVLGEDGTVSSFSVSADGELIAFTYEHEAVPAEIWVAASDGADARPLTRFNRDLVDSRALGRLQEFRFVHDGGGETQGFFLRAEFGGTIWENPDYYWDRSPLAHADRVTTPTLIIHSDQDMITPLGQGQEWFYALKALGIPTEMVVFHGEGHGLSRTGTPVNLVERLRRMLEWFERWDRPDRRPPS